MRNFISRLGRKKGLILNKKLYSLSHLSIVLKDIFRLPNKIYSTTEHLGSVMGWLVRAQDAAQEGGVSLGYSFQEGWLSPYPETTGYIIPTFFDYADYSGDSEYRKRAIRMCDWEKEIQLPTGAVVSGYYKKESENVPAVFNTGQVIFGWCRGYKETKNNEYLNCAKKAGDWLIEMQDKDGVWRRGLSPMPNSPPVHAYHGRVSWALIELFLLTDEKKYQETAMKNLDWVISQQNREGWFANNSFHNNQEPITHAICYTIEGLLGAGVLLGEERYKQAAILSAKNLMKCFEQDKKLYASYDAEWKSKDNYTCLTGAAQSSVIWLRIFEITKDSRFLNAALRMNSFLKTTQNVYSKNPGIRGGIKGSHPIYGGYCPMLYVNWAAKFFADALLLEEKVK